MKKIILTDIDGTLLNSEKKLTPKTKEALIKAQKLGHRLVLCSGRPTSGLYDLVDELDMKKYNSLLISFNGARVTECRTNKVLYNRTISINDSKDVLNHLKKFNVKPMIVKDNYMYVNNVFDNMITADGKTFNVIEYESRAGKFLLCEKEDLSSFVDYPLNKILIAGEPEYLQDNYKAIMEPFKDTLSCMFTASFFFEFTAKGIDKGNAIREVILPLGYKKEDIISFGDGENDISMIEQSGLGIAMGNAIDKLKEKAANITLSNDEDGIAFALEKYLF